MKIKLRDIHAEGLHIETQEPANVLFEQKEDQDLKKEYDFQGDLHYSLDIGMNAQGIWGTGRIWVDIRLQCVRCLTPFVYPVRLDQIAFHAELPPTEFLDLTPLIREDILLAIPEYPHCDWSGECVCRALKEHKVPEQAPQRESQRPDIQKGDSDHPEGGKRPSAWDALDQLDQP